jgi:glycerol-3-phosphate O-acyltransferase
MKQTAAVEWLIEELVKMDRQLDGRRKSEDATVLKMNPSKILEQAKEMEKQHIVDAFDDGYDLNNSLVNYNGEQYYNDTFKK